MSTSRTANRTGIAKPGISEHATLEGRELQVQRSGRACLSDKSQGSSGRRTAGEAVTKRNKSRSLKDADSYWVCELNNIKQRLVCNRVQHRGGIAGRCGRKNTAQSTEQ